MIYETASQAKENSAQLDPSFILSSVTKCFQLLGNVNSHISGKRRAQVLSKIGQRYTSLSNESWENNGKELFGQQFEQPQAAGRNSESNFNCQLHAYRKTVFSKGHLLNKTLATRGCNRLQQECTVQRPTLPALKAIQGKGQNSTNLHPANSSNPMSKLSSVPGVPLNLCLLSPVPKQYVGGRIAHFYQNWLNITSDPWVLETVLGHSIEFLESPYQSYLPTINVTTEEKELIDQEVLALQQKHAIHRVPESNSHD